MAKAKELELDYYSLDLLSDETGIPEQKLWLLAEQDKLKLSIMVRDKPLVVSQNNHPDLEEFVNKNLPVGAEIILGYTGYLQLRTRAIAVLRKYNRRSYKDAKFGFDSPEYPKHKFAQDMRGKRRVIFRNNIIVLNSHAKEFLRLISDPVQKNKDDYNGNKPYKQTTELYNEVFDIYVNRKIASLSTNCQDILPLLKKHADNTADSCVRAMNKESITWQAPTDAVDKSTSIKAFGNQISKWNNHYKKLGM
jgi:hypothetical protein